MNPASWLPLVAGCEFTQTRAHSLAELCNCLFNRNCYPQIFPHFLAWSWKVSFRFCSLRHLKSASGGRGFHAAINKMHAILAARAKNEVFFYSIFRHSGTNAWKSCLVRGHSYTMSALGLVPKMQTRGIKSADFCMWKGGQKIQKFCGHHMCIMGGPLRFLRQTLVLLK